MRARVCVRGVFLPSDIPPTQPKQCSLSCKPGAGWLPEGLAGLVAIHTSPLHPRRSPSTATSQLSLKIQPAATPAGVSMLLGLLEALWQAWGGGTGLGQLSPLG